MTTAQDTTCGSCAAHLAAHIAAHLAAHPALPTTAQVRGPALAKLGFPPTAKGLAEYMACRDPGDDLGGLSDDDYVPVVDAHNRIVQLMSGQVASPALEKRASMGSAGVHP